MSEKIYLFAVVNLPMKEIAFINRNKSRWDTFEAQLKTPSKIEPDLLADQFIRLTDDLAFARTFYPGSRTLLYLNGLSQKAHHEIYRNKREKSNRLITFFVTELPLELRHARKWFLLSLGIFLAAWALGVVSALNDDSFVRMILGDQYVNMTLDNIEKGDPMAVYGQSDQMPMFLMITFNNVFVSFMVFMFGVFTPIGTVFQLFRNGVMVGAFQAFFIQKNLLATSTLAIFIHGTLELSAIVLAGGAGILLGKNLLFPGTYSRIDSFFTGAKKGIKIMIGLVPVFIVAGFLEGFVTRLYHSIDTWINMLIILISLTFILWYFFIYPEIIYRKYINNLNKTNE